MPMPKPAMDDYDLAVPNEHQIRLTREVLPMQPKTITESVDSPPYDKLGVVSFNLTALIISAHLTSPSALNIKK